MPVSCNSPPNLNSLIMHTHTHTRKLSLIQTTCPLHIRKTEPWYLWSSHQGDRHHCDCHTGCRGKGTGVSHTTNKCSHTKAISSPLILSLAQASHMMTSNFKGYQLVPQKQRAISWPIALTSTHYPCGSWHTYTAEKGWPSVRVSRKERRSQNFHKRNVNSVFHTYCL